MAKEKDKTSDIHVTVSAEEQKEVVEWVCQSIATALQDRASLEMRWKKWIDQYEELLPEAKNFPWENCSNISVPLTAVAVETIHSREVNTLLSIRPYVQVRPKKKGVDKESCYEIEKFLDQLMTGELNFYDVASQWILEKNKMGTGFIKVYWCYDKKKTGKKNFQVINDARLSVVNIEDLIFPVNATDIQTCSFLAERLRLHWNVLKARDSAGIYKNVDQVKDDFVVSTVDSDSGQDIVKEKEQTVEKMQRTSPDVLKEYMIYEVYFDYDVDGDGYAEPTVMTIHKENKVVLRWIYHPYNHGRRPYIANKYQARVRRVYGKGIGEQSEHLQDAVNTTFNQAIDNMTISNIKCFKGRKTARKDVGKIYPGKTFWLDDPQSDLFEFSLGETHQSNFVLHTLLRDYHERRTKVTDYSLGKESSTLKSRATATGTLALLQESGRHFDLIINNTRNAIQELAYQIMELYAQFRPEKIVLVDGGNEFEEMTLPKSTNYREEYSFSCRATSLQVNKEIEKQANVVLLQQLSGIFEQMIRLLSLVFSPQMQMPPDLREFVMGVIRSYYTMAQDLVRSFEKVDIHDYLPELPEMVKEAYGQGGPQQMLQMLGGMLSGQAGGNPTVTGTTEASGMEAPYSESQG